MQTIKKIWAIFSRRLNVAQVLACAASAIFCATGTVAATCVSPERPFVPSDSRDARDYAELISRDFDLYFRDVQAYMRCLEQERQRAFEEAREVSDDYRRFLSATGDGG